MELTITVKIDEQELWDAVAFLHFIYSTTN